MSIVLVVSMECRFSSMTLLIFYMLKIESNKGFPPSCIGELSRLWLSCLGPLVLSLRSFSIIWLSDLSILNVHSESYSRKASFILNMTSTCLWRHAVVCHVIKVIKKDSCILNSLSRIIDTVSREISFNGFPPVLCQLSLLYQWSVVFPACLPDVLSFLLQRTVQHRTIFDFTYITRQPIPITKIAKSGTPTLTKMIKMSLCSGDSFFIPVRQ
jgi:hypothetical protein